MHMPDPQLLIAPMCLETVEAVAALERECFSTPWSLDSLAEELSNPIAVFYTAQINEDVAGYVGMHHIIDEGYITNIAVSGRYRRRGVASALLEALVNYAEAGNLRMLTLEVRPSNQAAIALYRQFRFEQAGARKSFYQNPAEDALILTRRL